MDGSSIGIDFGTCSIKVSEFDQKRNKVRQIKVDKKDNNADKKIPNVIMYMSRQEYQVGSIPEKKKREGSKCVVDMIKRKLELESWSLEFEELGFTLSATDIAQDIFAWLIRHIEEQGKKMENAVVTVPVCFTEVQKNRIMVAAKKSGLKIADTITEPVAALLSVAELFKEEGEKTVLIFDFGGATLDLCVCRIVNDGDGGTDIFVEGSYGIHFGGTDITRMLYEDVIYPKYREDLDSEIRDDILGVSERIFIAETDWMKEELFGSEQEKCDNCVDLQYASRLLEMQLTLEEALACMEKNGVKSTIIGALDTLFEGTDTIGKKDVTIVKTFGGTSRMLYVREILNEYFGPEVYDVEDYDQDEAYTAVADGAARYASILMDESSGISIVNAIPYCVGIAQGGYFKRVINRNQKYGVFTPYKNIMDIAAQEEPWRIVMYQSFTQDVKRIDAQDGAVYLGDLILDQTKYNDYSRILCKFGVTAEGKLAGMFYETNGDNVPVLVEEKEIVTGGA